MLSMLDYVMRKVLILELDYLWDNEKICTTYLCSYKL
jgi:hypothetical protein